MLVQESKLARRLSLQIMKSRYTFEEYINTLQENVIDPSTLIDFKKIEKNMMKVESDLNALNYLICNNESKFLERIEYLHRNNKTCFESINILLAIRKEYISKVLINNISLKYEELIESSNNIYQLFKISGLLNSITSGKIKNFVDYVFGVEVGMDINARKNRNGDKAEKILFHGLVNMFKDDDNIQIFEQKKIKIINDEKKFDIVIKNINSNKTFLIESSFYNAGGSKINETARGYYDLYKNISNNLKDYTFIWLADGKGISTIKRKMNELYNYGYIYNIELFFKNIRNIIYSK